MSDIDLGKSEDDMDPVSTGHVPLYQPMLKPAEKDHGDGSTLTRPATKSDGSKMKTTDALCKLGAGSSYGSCE